MSVLKEFVTLNDALAFNGNSIKRLAPARSGTYQSVLEFLLGPRNRIEPPKVPNRRIEMLTRRLIRCLAAGLFYYTTQFVPLCRLARSIPEPPLRDGPGMTRTDQPDSISDDEEIAGAQTGDGHVT